MSDNFEIFYPDLAVLDAERGRVFRLLAGALPGAVILEVGSTAIPGAIGKGDVDILVKVDRGDFIAARDTLDGMFARNPAQFSSEEFQGYTVDSPLDMAIQLTVDGCAHDVFETFLHAMRAHPALLESYNALKREWNGRPMDDYRRAKQAFIEAVLKREK